MNHKLMIAAMLDMGMRRDLADMLTEMAGNNEEINADGHRYLHGPVVVHGSAWRDVVPQWMIQAVPAERYRILHGLMPGYIVGPTELAAVMMPATMESPLYNEYVEMYCWAACKAVSQHYGPESEAAQNARSITNTKDDDFLKPGGQYYYTYTELAHDIRRRVIKHSTWRVPTNGKALQPIKAPRPNVRPRVVSDQLAIF